MQYVYIVCELIAGLGAFLIGVKLLSDNMEKLAASRFKDFFHRKPKTVPVVTAAEPEGLSDEEREALVQKTRRAAGRGRRPCAGYPRSVPAGAPAGARLRDGL